MTESLPPDLNLFEGMDGFEEFNPMDDSSLTAILDDLEEGTLLSLLGDESLLNDANGQISHGYGVDLPELPTKDILNDTREHPVCTIASSSDQAVQPSQTSMNSITLTSTTEPNVPKPVVEEISPVSKRPSQELALEYSNPLKRARLDSSTADSDYLLSCVHHDHSYAVSHRRGSSEGVSKGSSSDEEGSLSDGGYDTMSSSTSPGNGGLSTAMSPSSSSASVDSSSVLPPSSKVDPVALIDARLQYFMCSREVNLTEEEKETLKAEGLPIPTTLPLTKAEEKALRGVRRRIRNKVAAQESRKRKKEHLAVLEDKCKQFSGENHQLKRKVETLETENKSLRAEITKLRELLGTKGGNTSKTTRAGACLMVMVLCFAIFFGSITPHSLWSRPADYSTSSVRSRSLLSMEDSSNFKTQASRWFREVFMLEQFSEDYDHGPHEGRPDHDYTPLYGPLSYYEHVYTQVSGYLNFTNFRDACGLNEIETTTNSTVSRSNDV